MRENTLIIGNGEIGSSLAKVLQVNYRVTVLDKGETVSPFSPMIPSSYEVMHICFGYSPEFESEVKRYRALYSPKHTVIHSTVPVGTNTRLGTISSPVTGIHPRMEQSLLIFTKTIGGPDASQVADHFRRAGMKIRLFDKSETTELMKIYDTTFYGMCIEMTKEIKRVCDAYEVPFEAWTLATENYNDGYKMLGYPEYQRPNLVPIMKKIGGHCVSPNLELLDTPFTAFLKQLARVEQSIPVSSPHSKSLLGG